MKVPYPPGALSRRELASLLRACCRRLRKLKRRGRELVGHLEVRPPGLTFVNLDGSVQAAELSLFAYVTEDGSQVFVLDNLSGACVVRSRPGRWWQIARRGAAKGATP